MVRAHSPNLRADQLVAHKSFRLQNSFPRADIQASMVKLGDNCLPEGMNTCRRVTG
jgi:hypothetical protein